MFDLQKALSNSQLGCGTPHSFEDLRKAMSDIRIGHIAELPPEVGVNELIWIGRQKSLIKEDKQGRMFVVIPSSHANGTSILHTKDSAALLSASAATTPTRISRARKGKLTYR